MGKRKVEEKHDFKKLKEIRMKNHYTTLEMAKKVGISQGYYCLIENGKRRLYYDVAVKIAGVFNLKPDDLFY